MDEKWVYKGCSLWGQFQEYGGSPAIGDTRKVDRGQSLDIVVVGPGNRSLLILLHIS